jgi:hypothetical protein
MNYSYAPVPAANYAKPLTNAGSSISGLFSKFWAVLLVIFIVFVALVIYYKTVGYYLQIGWDRIYAMIKGRESVEIDIGKTVEADIMPMDAPPQPAMPPADVRPLGMPGAVDTSPFLSSLSIRGPTKEVFNVSRNIYTYSDASAVCSALGAELADYDQVKEAYTRGADWCNYGWTKGQMATYPTQKETWEKLQKGAAEYRGACGQPGVNGGYFDNPDLRFGVNCYGIKPPKNATDELLESQVSLPASPEEIEYDKKVQKFREQLNTTTVLPFKRGQWTE